MCIYLDVDFYYYSKFGQIHTHKKHAWFLWSFLDFHIVSRCGGGVKGRLELFRKFISFGDAILPLN